MKIGFDNARYVSKQKEHILERISRFDNKLYMEFGGKLFDDYHAARVLPGFHADAKLKLLKEFADKAEIIICIGAADIEEGRIRADLGITYDQDLLRLIDSLRKEGLTVTAVAITRYEGQPAAANFKKKLESRGMACYLFGTVEGYPTNVDHICSPDGFGKNPFIKTTRPLVVVTAPGPNSGKLALCLSQLYHEHCHNVNAGYAKFETFPIWNLDVSHPVNMAYEAATADLQDINMPDPYHYEAHKKYAVNYNRDINAFPIVRNILTRIMGDSVYKSPTDMGVNMAKDGIVDDDVVREAATREIIRRYYNTIQDFKEGRGSAAAVERITDIMTKMNLRPEMLRVVAPAMEKAERSGAPAVALELPDGQIVTGRTTDLMTAAAGCTLNAIKVLSGLDDKIWLLSREALEPIKDTNKLLGAAEPRLNLEQVLIALAMCASGDAKTHSAFEQLKNLRGCDAHSSTILSHAEVQTLRRLGINITCEATYAGKNLFYE